MIVLFKYYKDVKRYVHRAPSPSPKTECGLALMEDLAVRVRANP